MDFATVGEDWHEAEVLAGPPDKASRPKPLRGESCENQLSIQKRRPVRWRTAQAFHRQRTVPMAVLYPETHEVEVAAYYCHKCGGERHGHALKDWMQGEQTVFMAKNYVVLRGYRLQGERKQKLWNAEQRTCRYCGAVKPPDRGWKEAHALPELVGNKIIFAMDECTRCNDAFAKQFENDFGSLLNLAKSICSIPGKKGIPSFKTRTGKSRIDCIGDRFEIRQYEDDPFASFDWATNTLTMSAESQPLVPLAVYKCLTKMAIAVMPPRFLPIFVDTINWLKNPNHAEGAADVAASAKCNIQIQPGPMRTDAAWCLLLSRKDPNALLPETIFVLSIANHSFQIMIPCSPGNNHLIGHKVPLPEYPAFYGLGYEFGEPSTIRRDLSSPVRQRIMLSGSIHVEVAIKERGDAGPPRASNIPLSRRQAQ